MLEISDIEAKETFEIQLDRVQQGRGPVACLVAALNRLRAAEGAAELQQLRAEIAVRGGLISWSEAKELRDSGRPW